MNKQFAAILVIVVGLLIGMFIFTKDKSPDSGNGAAGQVSNHSVGAGTAGVTLIEYGDFQCPACKQYFPIVQEVKKAYGDKITFTFRHLPLVQIHPNAFIAARAAEAAGKQGKFFEMHDLLYLNQENWSSLPNPTEIFEQYAQQLELDVEKFKADVASEAVNATINADLKEAQSFGATSTPTFVLNGKKIDQNPSSVE
jgi:protein-disulfide isomerase